MTKFWGIGVGPGDSDLLTLKAVQTIRQLDVLYTPQAHRGATSVAETIAKPYLPADLTIKRRHFPMGGDWAIRAHQWQTIAAEIVADVKAGQEVGFLTLGDPSIYSTYSYIVDLLHTQINVVTIAGISAYSQIAASISTPLVLDDELLEIVPATAPLEKIETAIDQNDNVVIMKVATRFTDVYNLLAQRDLLGQATVVTNASMADERIKTMADYHPTDKLPYFTTLILKHTTRGNPQHENSKH
ncbi:cobalt-factor II C(20)-methyltransferase [Levilactobacillus cerevisiae]|uniref:cobalt-factor II C(20)-methyltransferase n=1 Tax=Levilactobacillus cerevisiae TaxID=1704076 RepID=UPI000F7A1715|nr:cobalt-factor II C(20)-methyltransferase [Levilactobacillus cerevisiae]